MRILPYEIEALVDVHDYHERPRVELVDIATRAGVHGTVLDLGCAGGVLGQMLLATGKCSEVVGVELEASVGDRARERLTRVVVGDLNDPALDCQLGGLYDTLIFADVLEHLAQPEPVLDRMLAHLAPEGICLISLPNVRHFRVLGDLLFRNDWIYGPQGVCDNTHQRFFTSRGAERLCAGAGLSIESMYALLSGRAAVVTRWCPPVITFLAAQVVLVARRSPGTIGSSK